MHYFKNAFAIAQELGDEKNSAGLARSIADIYSRNLKEKSKAKEYYHKSLAFYSNLGWKRDISEIKNELKYLE